MNCPKCNSDVITRLGRFIFELNRVPEDKTTYPVFKCLNCKALLIPYDQSLNPRLQEFPL